MIDLKNTAQIETMKQGGKILSDVLWEVVKAAKPGVSELELDQLAEKLIRERGGEPGFQRVPGYKHTICACTNDVVVHGIPSTYRLKAGDVLCIDAGVFLGGFHTDMAETIIVGTENSEVKTPLRPDFAKATSSKQGFAGQAKDKERFLAIGKKALEAGLSQVKPENHIGHISKAIQDIVEKEGGYSIVRSLIGHGVGQELHEEPEVPGFLDHPIEKTPKLEPGMTIAVEVIYNMGGKDVLYRGDDNWTIVSEDGSLSAVFERSIALTAEGSVLLTP